MPEDNSKELVNEGTEQAEALSDKNSEQSEETQGAGDQAGEQSTDSIDLNKLTPELQKVYKSLQADYTRKTQEVAEERKVLSERQRELDDKIVTLTEKLTPKGEDKPLVDVDKMDGEQRKAWDMLMKVVDEKVKTARKEERETFTKQFNQLQNQVSEMTWSSWSRGKDITPKTRQDMAKKWQEKGGVNSGLDLDEVYLLVKGEKGMKQAGAEEYKKSITKKREGIVSKPTSTAGSEAGIDFSKGRSHQKEDLLKAYESAKKDLDL